MYEMIDMHIKYDNIHKNIMYYVKICTNNHIITSINYILSRENERETKNFFLFARLTSAFTGAI